MPLWLEAVLQRYLLPGYLQLRGDLLLYMWLKAILGDICLLGERQESGRSRF
jgi:hypothetical protein